ncbi:AIG_G0043720.mRNA.1.CDS.1 [Saccharomyces cerevisiae]|nr:AIG_G0043720.mRNA.1.CDS.1 [Saccharomyces cerevisiae]CAI6852979.1 AIG_G0043720.mRNA.1.CDS.1 [Saccharomyces cerevisiae]
MKLADVLGAVAFTQLDGLGGFPRRIWHSIYSVHDDNENGLTAVALARNGSYIDDITVYGDIPFFLAARVFRRA